MARARTAGRPSSASRPERLAAIDVGTKAIHRNVVEVLSPNDVSRERAAARHRADLFERKFGRRLEFRQGLQAASLRGR